MKIWYCTAGYRCLMVSIEKCSRKLFNVILMEYKDYQPSYSSRSQCGSDFLPRPNISPVSPLLLGIYDVLSFSTSSKFLFTPLVLWGGNEGGAGGKQGSVNCSIFPCLLLVSCSKAFIIFLRVAHPSQAFVHPSPKKTNSDV